MKAEIISVGTEILLGDILNTNARFLAQELAALGVSVYYQTVVGDNHDRLQKAVRTAFDRSDMVVLTGGLGPTEDDLTKETVADALGDTLVLDEEELKLLQEHFVRAGRCMSANNNKQAYVPKHGYKLPNAHGTAPGIVFEKDGKMAILMPGPPIEMRPMFLEKVVPILKSMQDAVLYSTVLRIFGTGESDIEVRTAALLNGENPTAALYAKLGEVHLRITARAKEREIAKKMCEETAKKFRAVLGDNIYSENLKSLQEIVVAGLAHKKATLATAESCTGGMLSSMLTSVAGSSEVFEFGAVTYANRVKNQLLGVKTETLEKHGAVSVQTAAEMAKGALEKSGADYAVSITGIAGPGGGTQEKPVGLVYIGVASKKGVWVKKMQSFRREREFVRELACMSALDLVRRKLLALPLESAQDVSHLL